MSSFLQFAVGFSMLTAALVYAALELAVPMPWILAGTLVLLGLVVTVDFAKASRRAKVTEPLDYVPDR
jgi:xanthosine utilization system XapX-like protein